MNDKTLAIIRTPSHYSPLPFLPLHIPFFPYPFTASTLNSIILFSTVQRLFNYFPSTSLSSNLTLFPFSVLPPSSTLSFLLLPLPLHCITRLVFLPFSFPDNTPLFTPLGPFLPVALFSGSHRFPLPFTFLSALFSSDLSLPLLSFLRPAQAPPSPTASTNHSRCSGGTGDGGGIEAVFGVIM